MDIPDPDRVMVQMEPYGGWEKPGSTRVGVELSRIDGALAVDVGASTGVCRVTLRWHRDLAGDLLILGDAWERSYGELRWQSFRPERPLPWMFLAHERESGETWGAGVEVRGGSFAFWTVDPHGVSLWLDLRSGDNPTQPGSRIVHAATVRCVRGSERPFVMQCRLVDSLCRDPLLPESPLVGANNWYYAYGKDFDAAAVLRDARTISDLVGDHPVRPFAVVDDGWSAGGTADGRPASAGPWDRPRRPSFGEMTDLADALTGEGVRPGIWYRPLLVESAPPRGLRGPRDGAFALDISDPATLDTVARDVDRFVQWGFELIKHDFSTWDMFGRWGSTMGASAIGADGQPSDEPGPPLGWSPADSTVTNAEALVRFYRAVQDAAGETLVLGCNVVGHLAAGLTHAQRIGDDTSGRVWERTRRVGINALAFRLAQHRRFFVADADCVPSTLATDWQLNRQFLDLVARSGTALFVSVDPASRTDRVDEDLSAALRLALDGGVPGGIEPLDWMSTTTPERWRSGTDELAYDWLGDIGADPFEWVENRT